MRSCTAVIALEQNISENDKKRSSDTTVLFETSSSQCTQKTERVANVALSLSRMSTVMKDEMSQDTGWCSGGIRGKNVFLAAARQVLREIVHPLHVCKDLLGEGPNPA